VPEKLARRLIATISIAAVAMGCASSASARTVSSPLACAAAFPAAGSKSIGKTTWYNRQRSVEDVVCDGFGLDPSADFPLTSDFVCALVSQAIGDKFGSFDLYVDGACSADAIASDPKEATTYIGVACGWASDLLKKVAPPAGLLGSLGCAVAPAAGTSLGSAFESKHELEVAADIIGKGKCLKYSPTHFGSPWLAVTCDPSDVGFATLPRDLGTISVTRSTALGGFTVRLDDHRLPPTVAAARAYLGEPASVGHVGFKRDPECRLDWPAKHLTATFYHGYGGVLDSCAPRAGTLRVEFGRGWSMDTGVAVGGTVSALKQAYPRATIHGSTWRLVGSPTPWGSTIEVLDAEVKSGHVVAFLVAGPEAWDE
jgi:hypothetical protein